MIPISDKINPKVGDRFIVAVNCGMSGNGFNRNTVVIVTETRSYGGGVSFSYIDGATLNVKHSSMDYRGDSTNRLRVPYKNEYKLKFKV